MFENQSIEIAFSPEKKNYDHLIEDLCKEMDSLKEKIKNLENKNDENLKIIIEQLKVDNQNLKNDNENLKKEIKNLKEEIKEIKKLIEPIDKKFKGNNISNKYLFNNKSVIMKDNEFDLINLAIKSRLNKEIKELKKLYQATIDGDRAINFHSKCDGMPYTLVIVKSAGNRRFGGFISKPWSSNDVWEDDQNAFWFSLDKQKIYPYKNNGEAFYAGKDYGPIFGGGNDIRICSKCIQKKKSYTYESYSNPRYNYYGDINALSEDGKQSYFYIKEYEVFQIIFA